MVLVARVRWASRYKDAGSLDSAEPSSAYTGAVRSAPVAQWIEQRFPKPRALVRFRSGASAARPFRKRVCGTSAGPNAGINRASVYKPSTTTTRSSDERRTT
jgi:hypothetical protein